MSGGRLLSAPAEAGSLTALTSQQLGMQREIEQYLEGKAEQLLTQFMGAGNARVQVLDNAKHMYFSVRTLEAPAGGSLEVEWEMAAAISRGRSGDLYDGNRGVVVFDPVGLHVSAVTAPGGPAVQPV